MVKFQHPTMTRWILDEKAIEVIAGKFENVPLTEGFGPDAKVIGRVHNPRIIEGALVVDTVMDAKRVPATYP